MGAVAAALGGLQFASTVMGYSQQRRAGRAAERSANEQSAAIAEQRDSARRMQGELNAKSDAARKKLAVGMARSQRRRSRGGVFGDSAEVQSNTPSATLGG